MNSAIWKKLTPVLEHAAILAAVLLITLAVQGVSTLAGSGDLGVYGPMIAIVLTQLSNALVKWFRSLDPIPGVSAVTDPHDNDHDKGSMPPFAI